MKLFILKFILPKPEPVFEQQCFRLMLRFYEKYCHFGLMGAKSQKKAGPEIRTGLEYYSAIVG